MAESILGCIKELEKSITGNAPQKGINPSVFQAIFSNTLNKHYAIEDLMKDTNSVCFELRNKKEFDRALALELNIQHLLPKKTFPKRDLSIASFDKHFEVLKLLFLLSDLSGKGNISDLSWRLISHLCKVSCQNFRWDAPPELFAISQNNYSSVNLAGKTSQDLFFHLSGHLFLEDTSIEESRFGNYNQRLNSIVELPLNPPQIGNFEIESPKTSWFQPQTGDLFYAFNHTQKETSDHPFGINLELPPLPKYQESEPSYPYPASNTLTFKNPPSPLSEASTKDYWQSIIEELESNPSGLKYEPNTKKKRELWEDYEEEFRVNSLVTDTQDTEFLRLADNYLDVPEEYIDQEDLVQNLKLTLLNIPNKLVCFQNHSVKVQKEFRLSCMNFKVTYSASYQFLKSSEDWLKLCQFLNYLESQPSLLAPALASGLRKFATFYHSFVLKLPKITLLELMTQTTSLRDQLSAVVGICQVEELGVGLLDYLSSLTQANEGDAEYAVLLRMVFKKTLKPFLEMLRKFVYFGEMSDVFGEFVLYEKAQLGMFEVGNFRDLLGSRSNKILGSVMSELNSLGKTLAVLKQLEGDLFKYYLACSTGKLSTVYVKDELTPYFRLKFRVNDIKSILDDFTSFQTEQTGCLMELEKEIILEEQQAQETLFNKKLEKMKQRKNTHKLAMQLEHERTQTQKNKQWSFYQELQNQIAQNKEIQRIQKEKEEQKLKEEAEKEEQEQKELIEKGKKYLLDQYQEMIKKVYGTDPKESWRKRRNELNSKRMEFYAQEEKTLREEIQKQLDSDTQETIAPEEVSMQIEEPTEEPSKEPNYFPKKVKQPPGGTSSIGELFNYTEPQEVKPETPVEHPRFGYKEELEKFTICTDILWDYIITKALRQLNPRKKWEPKPLQKDIFSDLFPELPELNPESTYPLPFLLDKLIYQPIKTQFDFANKAAIHLFTRKLKLIDHLKALKRYSLLEAGDTIDLFLSTLFSRNFSGSVSNAWEAAFKMSSSKEDSYGDLVSVIGNKETWLGMKFRTVDDLEFLEFKYRVKGPLKLVVSSESLLSYSSVFTTLLRVKYISMILGNIKLFFHNSSIRKLSDQRNTRRMQLLRQKMQHFLDIFQGHIASEVHGTAWKSLVQSISQSKTVEDLISAHATYLETVKKNTFLVGKGKVVMENLKIVFNLVMRFQNLLLTSNPEYEFESETLYELETLETDFNRVHRFVYTMAKTMAHKGIYPELFLRLDFNNYLAYNLDKEIRF